MRTYCIYQYPHFIHRGDWGLKKLKNSSKVTQKQISNPGLFDILDIFYELRFIIWIQDKKQTKKPQLTPRHQLSFQDIKIQAKFQWKGLWRIKSTACILWKLFHWAAQRGRVMLAPLMMIHGPMPGSLWTELIPYNDTCEWLNSANEMAL